MERDVIIRNTIPAAVVHLESEEEMIALMTPQGFANLMSTMWPEMINAMPFGMGPVIDYLQGKQA